MQNKKTIVIFSAEENRDTAFAMKEYLMEDKTVLPIIIASEELNPALINIAGDKLIGDASRANAVFGLYGKLTARKSYAEAPKKTPEYNNDKTSHKKMRNIFKRYTPDLVLCLNARCLRAAIAVKNFLRSDTRIAVYLSEYLADKEYVYPEVDVYYALNEAVKAGLTEAGVMTNKIIVNPPITRKRFLNEIDGDVAKGEFGLPKDKPCALILANGYLNFKFSELMEKTAATENGYSYLVYCGYDRTLLKDLLKKSYQNVVARNEGMDMNLAFSAADVVIARPRGEYVAEAFAKEKLFLSYAAETEREQRIAGSLSVDMAAAADTPDGVMEILEAYRLNPAVYRKQMAELRFDPKESGERLKDFLIALT